MDTREFFEKIYPSRGVYLIAVKVNNTFKHKGFQSIDEAVKFALKYDSDGYEVYHACAAYKERPHKDETGKFVARTSSNWLAAKSFWVDIDCGQDKADAGKGYPTQLEACKALLQWCKDNEVPYPMLVSSGYGVHAYWCLTEEVTPEQWVKTATALKRALNDAGIKADPSRTSDFASVLRPVGTHNHKGPYPMDVKVVRIQKAQIKFEDFKARIEALSGTFEAPAWLTGEPVEQLVEYSEVESSIELVANKCKAVAMMRDTKGDVNYDHWRGVIGLIKYSKEDIDTAYDWSSKRAETGHNNVDVKTRYESWNSGPTTCSFFEGCCSSACEGCPFKGKIKTPLVLGREEPEPQKPEEVEATLENGQEVRMEIPELPKGYAWDGSNMVRYVKDKEGVLHAEPFCPFRFYLVGRLADETGKMKFQACAHLPRGVVREVFLDASIASAGGSKLLEALGTYEIIVSNHKNAQMNMHAYLKDSIVGLAQTKDVVRTFGRFGWQEGGGFLVGNRLYQPDETMVEVLLSGHAALSADSFPRPTGTLEDYAVALNWLYNRPGMEPMQYVICALWAAPLVEFCEPIYNGIPVAITGAESGKGKTTAAMAALYAFGDPAKNLCIAGKEGATVKAQAALVGTLKNLPMLFDEVTNKNRFQLSDICYALSNGTENLRLRSTGGRVEFADRESWRTHVAMTGNTHISARLADNGNSEAEAMRIFEIRIDSYDIPKLDPVEVSTYVARMGKNIGCAGEAIIKFLVANKRRVEEMMSEATHLVLQNPELAAQPKYRFYRNHMICTITMAKIAKELGIIQFNIDKMIEFAQNCVNRIFEEVAANNAPTWDVSLAKMLTDLSPRIITTPTYEVTNGSGLPIEVNCPYGIIGRAIKTDGIVFDNMHNNRMYLAASAVRSWCIENRVDATDFANKLSDHRVLLERRARISLGRGTNVTIPTQRCWVMDISRMDIEEEPEETQVQGDA